MKNGKYPFLILALLIFFTTPGNARSEESVDIELRPIIDAIQKMQTIENRPLIIAIGGCPGVGKSTISKLLQDELFKLDIVSAIVQLDHYGLSQEERKQFSSELDPRRIQWNKLHNNLTSIYNGENQIIKPTINQLTKEMGEETVQLTNVDCVLFEGTYVLSDFTPMNFLQYADLKVYLETPLENIYDWKWQRELKKSSPRTPQAFFHHMLEILQDFAFHVYPTRKNADYIIHVDFLHHYSITNDETMKTKVEPDFTHLRLETLSY